MNRITLCALLLVLLAGCVSGQTASTAPTAPTNPPAPSLPPVTSSTPVPTPTPEPTPAYIIPSLAADANLMVLPSEKVTQQPKYSESLKSITQAILIQAEDLNQMPTVDRENLQAIQTDLLQQLEKENISGEIYLFELSTPPNQTSSKSPSGLLPILVDGQSGENYAIFALNNRNEIVLVGQAEKFFIWKLDATPDTAQIGLVGGVKGVDPNKFQSLIEHEDDGGVLNFPWDGRKVNLAGSPAMVDFWEKIRQGKTAQLRKRLEAVINSEHLEKLGLSSESAAKWEAFADGDVQEFSDNDKEVLQEFLTKIEEIQRLVYIPTDSKPDIKTMELDDPTGESIEKLTPYVVNEKAPESNEGQFFLFTHDEEMADRHVALILAPNIEGLKQRLCDDGQRVDYLDSKDNVLITADAIKPDPNISSLELIQYFDTFKDYGVPRYHFPGMEASFYGLEKTPLSQIQWIKEAFAKLSTAPLFAAFEPYIWGKNNIYMVNRDLEGYAGRAHWKDNFMEINPKNVGTVIYFASTIAHEAAHIIQRNEWKTESTCEQLEFGNMQIPKNFWNWTSAEIVQALKDGKTLGAHHVSAWVLYHLGDKTNFEWQKQAILTGRYWDGSLYCK